MQRSQLQLQYVCVARPSLSEAGIAGCGPVKRAQRQGRLLVEGD